MPKLAFPDAAARKREVLGFIARGYNNAAIAARLSLTLKTVQNHVSNIFTKLQVTDRAQAIVGVREAGMAREAGARKEAATYMLLGDRRPPALGNREPCLESPHYQR